MMCLMPTPWELVGIVLGAIGAVSTFIAVPAYCQMKYGRPTLEVNLTHINLSGGPYKILCALIWNKPVQGKFLRRLGVTRTPIEELMAALEIRETGSGRVVSPMTAIGIGDLSGSAFPMVRFPASGAAKAACLIKTDERSGEVALFKGGGQTLAPGQYRARIRFSVEGVPFECSRDFVVQDVPPHLNWRGVGDLTVTPIRSKTG